MNFQQFATSAFGTRLWFSLGKLPPRAGRVLARGVTSALHSRKHSHIYRIIYSNQSVVLGDGAHPDDIDAMVGAVLRHHGMVAFDVVRAIAGGEDSVVRSIELGEEFWPNLRAACESGRGVLFCGAHLSAFNLAFLSFAITGTFPILVLSADMPAGGYQIVHNLMSRGSIESLPIGPTALRKAIQRLREGGVALTGVDWPIGSTDRIPFFGQPAQLPTGHVRLAMASNALLVPLACRWTPERGYHAMTHEPVALELSGDREADVLHNTTRVLNILEGWISETPEQWAMWHRVWPDIDAEYPF